MYADFTHYKAVIMLSYAGLGVLHALRRSFARLSLLPREVVFGGVLLRRTVKSRCRWLPNGRFLSRFSLRIRNRQPKSAHPNSPPESRTAVDNYQLNLYKRFLSCRRHPGNSVMEFGKKPNSGDVPSRRARLLPEPALGTVPAETKTS